MKAGMIFGIIGALIELLMGTVAFFIGSKVGAVTEFVGGEVQTASTIKQYIALFAPMLALVAACMAPKQHMFGVLGMAAGAILFAIAKPSIFSFVLSGLIVLGAVLIYLEIKNRPAN